MSVEVHSCTLVNSSIEQLYFTDFMQVNKAMSAPNSGKGAEGSSAPPYSYQYDNSTNMRAPPPSYEQSQQNMPSFGQQPAGIGMQMHIPSNQYYGMTHHQQLPSMYHGAGYGLAGPSTSSGAAASRVLNIDSRAELRTTTGGAVVIPPPPPGCLPTPAQLAAMQGKPVVVQQKKRTFF